MKNAKFYDENKIIFTSATTVWGYIDLKEIFRLNISTFNGSSPISNFDEIFINIDVRNSADFLIKDDYLIIC